MWKKRLWALFLACAVIAGACALPASAASSEDDVLYLEELEHEMVDLPATRYSGNVLTPRSAALFDVEIPSEQLAAMSLELTLRASGTVRFECTYSPDSASMDFGLVDETGHFYYLNVSGGSINKTIRVKTGGTYTVAIRNNSDESVTVVGSVSY